MSKQLSSGKFVIVQKDKKKKNKSSHNDQHVVAVGIAPELNSSIQTRKNTISVVQKQHRQPLSNRSIIVPFNERYTAITGSTQSASTIPIGYVEDTIAPGLLPRLSVECQIWQRYRFKKLKISYEPIISDYNVNAQGRFSMYVDFDVTNPVPWSITNIESSSPISYSLPSEPCSINLSHEKMSAWRYTLDNSNLNPFDPRFDLLARLYWTVYGTANSNEIGSIYMSGECEFDTPIQNIVNPSAPLNFRAFSTTMTEAVVCSSNVPRTYSVTSNPTLLSYSQFVGPRGDSNLTDAFQTVSFGGVQVKVGGTFLFTADYSCTSVAAQYYIKAFTPTVNRLRQVPLGTVNLFNNGVNEMGFTMDSVADVTAMRKVSSSMSAALVLYADDVLQPQFTFDFVAAAGGSQNITVTVRFTLVSV